MKWWGAEGRFPVTGMELDLQPGGKWTMSGNGIGANHSPSGESIARLQAYLEGPLQS